MWLGLLKPPEAYGFDDFVMGASWMSPLTLQNPDEDLLNESKPNSSVENGLKSLLTVFSKYLIKILSKFQSSKAHTINFCEKFMWNLPQFTTKFHKIHFSPSNTSRLLFQKAKSMHKKSILISNSFLHLTVYISQDIFTYFMKEFFFLLLCKQTNRVLHALVLETAIVENGIPDIENFHQWDFHWMCRTKGEFFYCFVIFFD